MHLDDGKQFQLLINRAQQSGAVEIDWKVKEGGNQEQKYRTNQYLIVTLIYLQIIHRVIRNSNFVKQKNLMAVYQAKDQFIRLQYVLLQFDQAPFDHLVSEDTQTLQDQIISVTLLLLNLVYVNKRTKFGEKPLYEKVASSDTEKKTMLKTITDHLNQNTQLMTETYLTLMLITFDKKGSEKIPSVETVQAAIKQSKVRVDGMSHTKVIDFDIDFLFVVLTNLDKYSEQTKFLLLNQFMLF